jgi:hypothetical protein
MNRICETCLKEKAEIEGTFQQVCTTPECIVMMIKMAMEMGIGR